MAACGATVTMTTAQAAPKDGPEAAHYWTAERMAAAKPVEAKGARGGAGAGAAASKAVAAPKGTPKGTFGDGISMVGTFFSHSKVAGNTSCTGSVIHSAGHDLVLTAAHCARGMQQATDRIFVPQYRKGLDAAKQKFGAFPVQSVFIDKRWLKAADNKFGPESSLDFAFIRVGVNDRKAKIEDRTGSLRLTATPGPVNTVRVLGYPVGSSNPGQQAISCTVPTAQYKGWKQLQMLCGGYYGGVSGGPWIANWDAKRNTGDVIGIVGGYNGGGDRADDDWISYSPVFDGEIQNLYQAAVAGQDPADGLNTTPNPRPVLRESSGVWRHAKQLAAGDFGGQGRDDLLVAFDDGQVSLYPNDGNGGLGKDSTLKEENNPYWKGDKVRAIAGGPIGGGRAKLAVLWAGGKLSLFGDVGPSGLRKETMIGSYGEWKNARKIAITASGDLIVLWKDGELSLYSGVTATGKGKEKQLRPKNSEFAGADALAAGGFSGGSGTDLLVRLADGQLKAYPGTGRGGLGPARVVQGANASYTGTAMVLGGFTPGGGPDDLIVRWSDGETSRYDRPALSGLGDWSPLVS